MRPGFPAYSAPPPPTAAPITTTASPGRLSASGPGWAGPRFGRNVATTASALPAPRQPAPPASPSPRQPPSSSLDPGLTYWPEEPGILLIAPGGVAPPPQQHSTLLLRQPSGKAGPQKGRFTTPGPSLATPVWQAEPLPQQRDWLGPALSPGQGPNSPHLV